MNILIVYNGKLPSLRYGGVERVIWYLGSALASIGHKVSYLVQNGSYCPFANVIVYDPTKPLPGQIPFDTDLVHFNFQPDEVPDMPYLVTIHGNLPPETEFFRNTNFVSKNHAKRYGADAYVYNGLDWNSYGKPDYTNARNYVHFLGKAAWRVKNVKDAIRIAARNKIEIKIMGGTRINLKMGVRITFSRRATFYGMVDDKTKTEVLRHSKGLIFPVQWHEPFGLAVIESLYFGCPVLGTAYGSLPELVPAACGFLSNSIEELVRAFKHLESYNRPLCNEYVSDLFNSAKMAQNYIGLYERVLNGEPINKRVPAFVEDVNVLH